MLCESCAGKARENQPSKGGASVNEPLIYDTNFGIVNILKYFQKEPMSTFGKIALDEGILKKLRAILKSYLAYHLDVGKLKSEDFIIN